VEAPERRQSILQGTYQFTCSRDSCVRCFPPVPPAGAGASAGASAGGYVPIVQISSAFAASGSFETVMEEELGVTDGQTDAQTVDASALTTALLPGVTVSEEGN
jgi:hypothetical protein